MMFQIVFNVQVAGNGQAPLYEAYGGFSVASCTVENCDRRAHEWTDERGWVCDRPIDEKTNSHRSPENPAEADKADRGLPSRWAAATSYLTLTRYADISLRSFAYFKNADDSSRELPSNNRRSSMLGSGDVRWRVWGNAMLIAVAGLFLALAWFGLNSTSIVNGIRSLPMYRTNGIARPAPNS